MQFSLILSFLTKTEGLGTMYLAEPVCDDITATLPLELYSVSFDTQYYSTTQGNILLFIISHFSHIICRKEEAPTSGSRDTNAHGHPPPQSSQPPCSQTDDASLQRFPAIDNSFRTTAIDKVARYP